VSDWELMWGRGQKLTKSGKAQTKMLVDEFDWMQINRQAQMEKSKFKNSRRETNRYNSMGTYFNDSI
jgi:hypothetical protein